MRRAAATVAAVLLAAVLLAAVPSALAQTSGASASPGTAAAGALTAAIDGVVRDSAGQPLEFVLVSLASAGRAVYSDSTGAFRLGELPPGAGRFSIRRMGYVPSDFDVDLPAEATVHLAVTMKSLPRWLETVVIDGKLRDAALSRVGFYDRAATTTARFGSGRFLAPEALEPWRKSWLTAPLRQVPFIRVEGAAGRTAVQFRDAHARLGCAPTVWIDGAPSPTPVGALDDLLPVTEVRAVEVYPWPRSVPLQFRVAGAPATCGALVIWTSWLDDRRAGARRAASP